MPTESTPTALLYADGKRLYAYGTIRRRPYADGHRRHKLCRRQISLCRRQKAVGIASRSCSESAVGSQQHDAEPIVADRCRCLPISMLTYNRVVGEADVVRACPAFHEQGRAPHASRLCWTRSV